MRPKPEKLWTIEDLAEFLQVKPSVVKYWVNNNGIPYIKIGKFIRFDEREIKSWVEENKVEMISFKF